LKYRFCYSGVVRPPDQETVAMRNIVILTDSQKERHAIPWGLPEKAAGSIRGRGSKQTPS